MKPIVTVRNAMNSSIPKNVGVTMSETALTHEFQHPDGASWCIHCGTFNCYCDQGDGCDGTPGSHDTRVPAIWRKQVEKIFGCPAEETIANVEGIPVADVSKAFKRWEKQYEQGVRDAAPAAAGGQ